MHKFYPCIDHQSSMWGMKNKATSTKKKKKKMKKEKKKKKKKEEEDQEKDNVYMTVFIHIFYA